MDAIISFFTFLQGLGVSVMMPIIITIISCCLGTGFGKSLKAGLMVCVGFIGLNLEGLRPFWTRSLLDPCPLGPDCLYSCLVT